MDMARAPIYQWTRFAPNGQAAVRTWNFPAWTLTNGAALAGGPLLFAPARQDDESAPGAATQEGEAKKRRRAAV